MAHQPLSITNICFEMFCLLFVCFGGIHVAVLCGYSWLCTQELPLVCSWYYMGYHGSNPDQTRQTPYHSHTMSQLPILSSCYSNTCGQHWVEPPLKGFLLGHPCTTGRWSWLWGLRRWLLLHSLMTQLCVSTISLISFPSPLHELQCQSLCISNLFLPAHSSTLLGS